MNSSKENIVYISKYIPSQPILCTKIRVLVLSFYEVLFLIFYPLLSFYLRWKPPWHSLMKILVLATKPFVGIGANPRFNSNSTPTSPNYWPFQQHQRSKCTLTRSSNRGLQDTGVYNQRKYKWIQRNNTERSSYSLSPLDLLCELCLKSNTMMQ